MHTYIRTFSGKKFYFLRPTVNQINITDIAYALSGINRFTGHTRYTVAQHCCYCCDLLPDNLKLEGLLHDASEAYTGDCNSPLKHLLPEFREIEERAERVIARKFKLKFPYPADIKRVDLTMLATEFRDLIKYSDFKDLPFAPISEKLVAWNDKKSYEEFIMRYEKYKRK